MSSKRVAILVSKTVLKAIKEQLESTIANGTACECDLCVAVRRFHAVYIEGKEGKK